MPVTRTPDPVRRPAQSVADVGPPVPPAPESRGNQAIQRSMLQAHDVDEVVPLAARAPAPYHRLLQLQELPPANQSITLQPQPMFRPNDALQVMNCHMPQQGQWAYPGAGAYTPPQAPWEKDLEDIRKRIDKMEAAEQRDGRCCTCRLS